MITEKHSRMLLKYETTFCKIEKDFYQKYDLSKVMILVFPMCNSYVVCSQLHSEPCDCIIPETLYISFEKDFFKPPNLDSVLLINENRKTNNYILICDNNKILVPLTCEDNFISKKLNKF